MPLPTLDGEVMTQVVDADIPRVDLVDKAANGRSFILMKSEESSNLLSTNLVQELITKAEEPNMTAAKPGSWIAKADDPTIDEPLIEPSGAAAGLAASDPGSPAWEQIDADSAANAYAVLARVDNTLGLLAGREEAEAFNGADDGEANAFCLEDAQAAVEYAMDTVAVYAASEALDATPLEKAASIIKSLAGLTDALTTVESYGLLRKAGRTLSASNESKLRSASEQITSVLASLPAAPDEVTKEAATVVKEVPASEVVEKSEIPETIEKADDESAGLQAVFDASGNLVGVVDPTAIQPVSGTSTDSPDAEPDADDAPAASVDPDAAPAPAEVGAPTDEVTKSLNVEDIVKSAVDEVRAEQAELIKGLRDDIDFLKAPAAPRAFTNGADGSVVTRDGEVLKGAEGSAEALIKAAQDAPDSATRTKFNNQRGAMARELLAGSRPTL
jgi:hypothetical protein